MKSHMKIEKIKRIWRKSWKIITIISVVSGICGITLKDLFFYKDWNGIAEKYNNAGLEHYNSSNYQAAIEQYDKAINLESKGINNIESCYYNRAMAYYKKQDYIHAIGDFTAAIELNPISKYYYQRGITYEAMGEMEKATLDYIKANVNNI